MRFSVFTCAARILASIVQYMNRIVVQSSVFHVFSFTFSCSQTINSDEWNWWIELCARNNHHHSNNNHWNNNCHLKSMSAQSRFLRFFLYLKPGKDVCETQRSIWSARCLHLNFTSVISKPTLQCWASTCSHLKVEWDFWSNVLLLLHMTLSPMLTVFVLMRSA